MFDDSIIINSTLSFDSWSNDRKIVYTQLKYQVVIGSAQNINGPKYLSVTHQTAARIRVPNKANDVAVFDILDVAIYHIDNDGIRYPRDGVSIDYGLKDYVDRYRDRNLFYKEYVGEELLNSSISYTDVKTEDPIQVTDLRFQVDHINPEKIQLFEEHRGATNIARLFMILIRHRENRMIAEGDNITEVNLN